jgi:hypothetical protein
VRPYGRIRDRVAANLRHTGIPTLALNIEVTFFHSVLIALGRGAPYLNARIQSRSGPNSVVEIRIADNAAQHLLDPIANHLLMRAAVEPDCQRAANRKVSLTHRQTEIATKGTPRLDVVLQRHGLSEMQSGVKFSVRRVASFC